MDPKRISTQSQVEALTQRITLAEEQIRQLIELTNTMRNEIASQQRIINAFTTINAERKLSNSKKTMENSPAVGVSPKANNSAALDAWELNDVMDIDWDALDGLTVSAMNSSTNVTILDDKNLMPVAPTSAPPSNKHSRDESTDNDYPHEIKAMRYDSLDRILAYTVQASAVSDKNILKIDHSKNYDEERLSLSKKIFRYMNVGDMNALSKLVSESFCDTSKVQFYPISESVVGKAEAMMLFSLLYESYPDGMWKLTSTEVNNKVVTAYYTFTGTSVFDTPLSVSFQQVKEHERSQKGASNAEKHAGNQIVRNVAEMAANTHHHQVNHTVPADNGNTVTNLHAATTMFGLPSLHTNNSFKNTTIEPLNTRSRSFTNPYPTNNTAPQRKSLGQIEIDLTGFSIYDRINTPRSSDADDTSLPCVATESSSARQTTTSGDNEAEVDIIKIPRSKGNESFRLEVSRTGTIQPLAGGSRPGSVHRAPSLNCELMANALIKKSEIERRKCEITFNDYNLIVLISITACPR